MKNYFVKVNMILIVIFLFFNLYLLEILRRKYPFTTFYSDPSYAYLFNAYLIESGTQQIFTDNPGITVILFLVVINKFFSSLLKIDFFTNLSFAEQLYISKLLIIALFIFILIILIKIVTDTSQKYFLFTFSSFILIPKTIYPLWGSYSPELFVWYFSFLIIYLSILYSINKNKNLSFLIGVLTSFAISTKLNSLILLAIFFIFYSKRDRIIYLLTTLTGLIFFYSTISSRLTQFFGWVTSLIKFEGKHGSGSSQFISTENFVNNLMSILSNDSLVILFLFFTLLYFFTNYFKKKTIPNYEKVFVLIITIQILISLRSYSPQYLIPIYPILSYFSLKFVFDFFKLKTNFFLLILPIMYILLNLISLQNESKLINKEFVIINNILKSKDTSYYIGNWLLPLPATSVQFGNRYSAGMLSDLIHEKYPGWLFTYGGHDVFTPQNTPVSCMSLQKERFKGRSIKFIFANHIKSNEFPFNRNIILNKLIVTENYTIADIINFKCK